MYATIEQKCVDHTCSPKVQHNKRPTKWHAVLTLNNKCLFNREKKKYDQPPGEEVQQVFAQRTMSLEDVLLKSLQCVFVPIMSSNNLQIDKIKNKLPCIFWGHTGIIWMRWKTTLTPRNSRPLGVTGWASILRDVVCRQCIFECSMEAIWTYTHGLRCGEVSYPTVHFNKKVKMRPFLWQTWKTIRSLNTTASDEHWESNNKKHLRSVETDDTGPSPQWNHRQEVGLDWPKI